ncbi:MAG: hypothetical protein DESF_02574 [Desulfovibrio sp.]
MSNGECRCLSELSSSKAEIDTNALNSAIQEDRRLMILLFLVKSSGYTLNNNLLKSLLELVGHHTSCETLHNDHSWLEKHALVKCESSEFGLTILTLTRTGWDMAMGQQILPGVRRPHPGEIENWKLYELG